MAYSNITYIADGVSINYSIPFSYIEKDNVKVYLNGVLSTSYTWTNDYTITLNSVPVNGTIIRIIRETNINERLVDYQDGSTLTEEILDLDSKQAFYLIQESTDFAEANLGIGVDNNFDALNKKIVNVADPVNPQDAVTLNYFTNNYVQDNLVVYMKQVSVAVPSQTTFTLVNEYIVGSGTLEAYVDGVKLNFTEYTELNSTTVVLVTPLAGGEQVEFVHVQKQIVFDADVISYNENLTLKEKVSQFVSVKDFGAMGNGITDDTVAFQNALNFINLTEKVLHVPKGDYVITNGLTVNWALIKGEGTGSTNLLFKDFTGKTGITFNATADYYKSCGISDLSIKLVNSQGNIAISTPRGATLNNNKTKYFFHNLSFEGVEATGFTRKGFEQLYSWNIFFDLGDSWLTSLFNIDALGRYRVDIDPSLQVLDKFVVINGDQGILSAKFQNITTHNISCGFEIKDRVFWFFDSVDVSQSYKGIYTVRNDATTIYGEGSIHKTVINSQLVCVDLEDRIATMVNHLTCNRSNAGFDHGTEWVGIRLEDASKCNFNNIKIYAGFNSVGGRFTGNQIGVKLLGGSVVNFSNMVFQALDRCFQSVTSPETSQIINGLTISNVNTETNIPGSIVFDFQQARRTQINNVTWGSGYEPDSLISFGDTTTARSVNITNVMKLADEAVATTGIPVFITDFGAAVDEKFWFLVSDGGDLRLQTRSDNGLTAANAILINRTATTVDKIELRATDVYLNGNVQFGTWTSSGAVSVNGYITIKDAAGNTRKLATIA